MFTLLRCRKYKCPWNSVISAIVGSMAAPFSLSLHIKKKWKDWNTYKITFVKLDRFSNYLQYLIIIIHYYIIYYKILFYIVYNEFLCAFLKFILRVIFKQITYIYSKNIFKRSFLNNSFTFRLYQDVFILELIL